MPGAVAPSAPPLRTTATEETTKTPQSGFLHSIYCPSKTISLSLQNVQSLMLRPNVLKEPRTTLKCLSTIVLSQRDLQMKKHNSLTVCKHEAPGT